MKQVYMQEKIICCQWYFYKVKWTKSGIEGDSIVRLKDGYHFNANFINKTYFGSRPIYEIKPEEYEEFLTIYEIMQNTSNPLIRELPDYVRGKFSELDDEQIEMNSREILFSSVALLKYLPCIDIPEGEVLKKAIEAEREKLSDLQDEKTKEDYLELCSKAVELFSKGNWPGSEMALEAFEEFQDKLVDHEKDTVSDVSISEKLVGMVEKTTLRFGEVASNAVAFSQGQNNYVEPVDK